MRRLAKIGSGTKATFAPNSEIWACKKADTAKKTWFYGGFLWGSCQGSCTIIESSPRDWLGWSFWRLWGVSGALHKNWFGTTATFGLGQNLLIQALWERFWRYKKKKSLLNSRMRQRYRRGCHWVTGRRRLLSCGVPFPNRSVEQERGN